MKNTELKPAEQTSASVPALVTLDPAAYVAQVYDPFKARLEAAIAASSGVTYDITTTAGLDAAKKLRASFRDIRTQGENERKARKAPILEIGKLLDSKYDELKALVAPHEEKFDKDVKAEEQRREDEKAEKIRIEAERQAALDAKISHIKDAPLRAINMTAEDTLALIEELQQIVPTAEVYEDRHVEAEAALHAVIPSLQTLHQGKAAIERQQAETAERERQAQEQQKEQARIDAIKARIGTIKNYVLEAADCDKSADMETIIAKVEAENIDDTFAEFKDEAKEAKEGTLNALRRQLKYIKLDEEESQQAEAAKAAPVEEVTIAAPVAQPAPAIAPAAQVVAARIPDGDGIVMARDPAHELTVPATQYFYGTAPDALDLVRAVAVAYKVDEPVALGWLQNTDFHNIVLAKAA